MSATPQRPAPILTPYKDILSAREAARIFSRANTPMQQMLLIAGQLEISGIIGHKIIAGMLETFHELVPDGRVVVLHTAAAFVLGEMKNGVKVDDNLVKGLAALLNFHDAALRVRAHKVLIALGANAAAAQDYALGCIRNVDPQIRLSGAQLLYTIGRACNRSLVKPMRLAVEKYPNDTDFCRILNACIVILNTVTMPGRPA